MRPLALLIPMLLASCDPTYSLCAYVVRCTDEEPLQGAELSVEYARERISGPTEKDGSFCIARLEESPPDRVVLSVRKDGYCPKSGVIENPPSRNLEPIRLMPTESPDECPDPEGAPDTDQRSVALRGGGPTA